MKSVPIKDLKENLSYWAEEASKGSIVEVTKHNRPYVALVRREGTGLFIGRKVGKARLIPALKGPTKGKWLEVLSEDRND